MGVLHSNVAFPTRAFFERMRPAFIFQLCRELAAQPDGLWPRVWSRREFLSSLTDISQLEETGEMCMAPIQIFNVFDVEFLARVDASMLLIYAASFAGPANADSHAKKRVFAVSTLLAASMGNQITRARLCPVVEDFYSLALRLGMIARPIDSGEADAVLDQLWAHIPFKAKSHGHIDANALRNALATERWQHELIQRCRMDLSTFEVKFSNGDVACDPLWHVDEIVAAEADLGVKSSLLEAYHPVVEEGATGTSAAQAGLNRSRRFRGHTDKEYTALFKAWKQKKRLELLTSRNVLSELVSRTGLEMEHVMTLKQRFLGMADVRGELSFPAFQMLMVEIFPTFQGDSSMLRLFQSFDADGNGAVDFREFISGVGRMTNGSLESKLRLMFELFDQRNTGQLTLQDLLHFVNTSSDEMLELFAMAHNVVGEMKTSVPGVISESEFAEEMAASPALMSCLDYALHLPTALGEQIHEVKLRTLALTPAADQQTMRQLVSATSSRCCMTFADILHAWDDYNANQSTMAENSELFTKAMLKQTRDRLLRANHFDTETWMHLGSSDASDDDFAALAELIARGRSAIWLHNGNELVHSTIDLSEFCAFMLITFRLSVEEIPLLLSLFKLLSEHQGREEISMKETFFSFLASCAVTNAEKARAVFRNGDIIGKGRLSSQEVMNVLLASQNAMSGGLEATLKLLHALDINGDGELSWEEFRDGIVKTPELLQCFGSLLGTSSSNSSHFTVARMQAAGELESTSRSISERNSASAPPSSSGRGRLKSAPSRSRLLPAEGKSMMSLLSASRPSSPKPDLKIRPQTSGASQPPFVDTGVSAESRRRGRPVSRHSAPPTASDQLLNAFESAEFSTVFAQPTRNRLDSAASKGTFGGIELFTPAATGRVTHRVPIADMRPVYAGRRTTYRGTGNQIKHKLNHGQTLVRNLQLDARKDIYGVLSKPGAAGLAKSVQKLRDTVARENGVRARRAATATNTSGASKPSGMSRRPASAKSRALAEHKPAKLKLVRPQTAHVMTARMKLKLEAQRGGVYL